MDIQTSNTRFRRALDDEITSLFVYVCMYLFGSKSQVMTKIKRLHPFTENTAQRSTKQPLTCALRKENTK